MKRFLFLVMATSVTVFAQTQSVPAAKTAAESERESCPLHAQHMKVEALAEKQRFAQMNERGEQAMGFSQTKTTHHFISLPDGGAIEVTVNDPGDASDLGAIRLHFTHIAKDFAHGDFAAPMMTHGEMPPGAELMQKLKDRISYRYEELSSGARVRISTTDPEALKAVHEFFAYQIQEHRTGDAAPGVKP